MVNLTQLHPGALQGTLELQHEEGAPEQGQRAAEDGVSSAGHEPHGGQGLGRPCVLVRGAPRGTQPSFPAHLWEVVSFGRKGKKTGKACCFNRLKAR